MIQVLVLLLVLGAIAFLAGRYWMDFARGELLLVLRNGPAYGLELMRATGFGPGTVYPILRKLEVDGLVTSEERYEEASDVRGGRPRIYYRLR